MFCLCVVVVVVVVGVVVIVVVVVVVVFNRFAWICFSSHRDRGTQLLSSAFVLWLIVVSNRT